MKRVLVFIACIVVAFIISVAVSASVDGYHSQRFVTAFSVKPDTSLFNQTLSDEDRALLEPQVTATFESLYANAVIVKNTRCDEKPSDSDKAACTQDRYYRSHDANKEIEKAVAAATYYGFSVPPMPNEAQEASIMDKYRRENPTASR